MGNWQGAAAQLSSKTTACDASKVTTNGSLPVAGDAGVLLFIIKPRDPFRKAICLWHGRTRPCHLSLNFCLVCARHPDTEKEQK